MSENSLLIEHFTAKACKSDQWKKQLWGWNIYSYPLLLSGQSESGPIDFVTGRMLNQLVFMLKNSVTLESLNLFTQPKIKTMTAVML